MEVQRTDEQILAGIIPRISSTEEFKVQHGIKYGNNIRGEKHIYAFVDSWRQALRIRDALNARTLNRRRVLEMAFRNRAV